MGTCAIVTGGTSGLGLALATRLTRRHRVVVVGRAVEGRDGPWGDLDVVLGSVGDPATVDEAFDRALSIGTPRLVVNCAGVGIFGGVGSRDRTDIDTVLEGNLIGTILFSERAAREMEERGGLIVNVLSTAATTPRANEAIYCAAKWGARGYTDSLRVELKGTRTGVVAIYPGGMNTEFWRRDPRTTADASKFMDPNWVAERIDRHLDDLDGPYVSDLTINRR